MIRAPVVPAPNRYIQQINADNGTENEIDVAGDQDEGHRAERMAHVDEVIRHHQMIEQNVENQPDNEIGT
ncbi:hypothetical protein TKK_0014425 [Trichogramma kaykai]